MALTGANELKRKLLIAVDGQPYLVLDVFFASPTARGGATMVRTRLRHVLTGAVMEKSFRSSEKFEEPDIETVPASFLRSEEHTSELQSPCNLVCRLLLEKKKDILYNVAYTPPPRYYPSANLIPALPILLDPLTERSFVVHRLTDYPLLHLHVLVRVYAAS